MISTAVSITFAITICAYKVVQADVKSILAQAFAMPLETTAMAAHSANWLKRGRAILRSDSSRAIRAKMPPTQSDKATTWTTSEPIAKACEPPEALWL